MDIKLEKIEEFSNAFAETMKQNEAEQEEWWNSLSKEDQLKAFCAVVRRIYRGEFEDRGSYRHVLYGVFGFGPESYAQAQDAGYLELHNSIVDSEYDGELLRAFCRVNNIEDYDKKVVDFLI